MCQGPALWALCHRKIVTTHASLTGWGAVIEGCSAKGLCSSHHLTWHINYLIVMSVLWVLKYFLPDLRGHHVLISTDNMSVVINHRPRLLKTGATIPGQTVFPQGHVYSWSSEFGSRHLLHGRFFSGKWVNCEFGPWGPNSWMKVSQPRFLRPFWSLELPLQVNLPKNVFTLRESNFNLLNWLVASVLEFLQVYQLGFSPLHFAVTIVVF